MIDEASRPQGIFKGELSWHCHVVEKYSELHIVTVRGCQVGWFPYQQSVQVVVAI